MISLKSWKRGTILVFLVFGFLVLVASASAATVPTFGKKVTVNDGSGRIQMYGQWSVRASVSHVGNAVSKTTFAISTPKGGTGTRTKTWTLYGSAKLLNGGKRFPLAQVRTTVTFTLIEAHYVEKIWNYNFDAYWNICVNGPKDVYAEGGNVYCEIYHAGRIDVVQKSKIVKNYPRPRVVKTTTERLNPADLPFSFYDNVGCGDDHTGYPQDTIITAKIPQIAGGMKVVTTHSGSCSNEPLPGPTATVTNISPIDKGFITITGTVTNNYRGSCFTSVSVTNSAGISTVTAVATMAALATTTWSTSYWYPPTDGTPTTTATVSTVGCF